VGVYGVSEDRSVERLSVGEAAERLGVTRDAIHKRISRGSIRHEKGEDGRLYVYVDTSTTDADASTDASKDESKVEALERLIEHQQDRTAFLEREMDRRGEETERLHHIVAGLTRTTAELSARLPELEAPAHAPGATTGDRGDHLREQAEADNNSETSTPRSRESRFLPPLQDKLPLRDYVLALGMASAVVFFVQLPNMYIAFNVSSNLSGVLLTVINAINIIPWDFVYLLPGFWLGLRRRGGLSRTSLGIMVLLFAFFFPAVLGFVRLSANLGIQGLSANSLISNLWPTFFGGLQSALLVIAGALLGKAVQRRGLNAGIYGDDPAASSPRLQDRRAVSGLVIGSGAATIIAALINAVANVIAS
jgi:excisionase family DNA binding protein